MGRSRRRQRAAGTPAARRTATTPKRAPAGRERALDRLGAHGRVLAGYLAGAVGIAVLALLGTATLGGALAPWLVLAVVAALGYALARWSTRRLAGQELSDEDRLLQTLAGGLLVLAALFALVAAVALTV